MVNNSTNNKTNLPLSHLTQKKPRHMTLEIQAMASDRYTNVAGLNLLMGSHPPILITGSPTATAIHI